MRTVTAKQFSNVPTWQQEKAVKQAKKQAKQQRQQRQCKHNMWVDSDN